MDIIIGREGTQKTPITDKSVSRRHCKVTPSGDGTYIVENLSNNGTKVDGRDIIRTTARLNSRLQLGPVFSATLVELIGAPATSGAPAPKPTPAPSTPSPKKEEVPTFRISHLKRVWEEFEQKNLELAVEQRKTNLTRTGLGIFTMCTMPLLFFWGPVAYALTGIAILGNIYSFVGMKNAESPEEKSRRQDAFDEKWVCPNPKCGHSLMAKNYRMLVRNYQSCPFCKCKYVE